MESLEVMSIEFYKPLDLRKFDALLEKMVPAVKADFEYYSKNKTSKRYLFYRSGRKVRSSKKIGKIEGTIYRRVEYGGGLVKFLAEINDDLNPNQTLITGIKFPNASSEKEVELVEDVRKSYASFFPKTK